MGKPRWRQFKLETGRFTAEELEEALSAAGAIAVTFEDASDNPILEPAPGETPLWQNTVVTGLFPADGVSLDSIQTALCRALGTSRLPHLEHEDLEDRAWARAWMDHFQPMRFGRRLWICPSHRDPPEASAVNVSLDPGLAFGSGTHPSTALCLEWLDGRKLGGHTVVDYGCGSGILGIAAALLGASRVWCVDIDPQALVATRSNAADNVVDGHVGVSRPEELGDVEAQTLTANILAAPLIALAPRLASLVAPGGSMALSGLLRRQADEVEDRYSEWVEFGPRSQRDGWALVQGVRRPLVR